MVNDITKAIEAIPASALKLPDNPVKTWFEEQGKAFLKAKPGYLKLPASATAKDLYEAELKWHITQLKDIERNGKTITGFAPRITALLLHDATQPVILAGTVYSVIDLLFGEIVKFGFSTVGSVIEPILEPIMKAFVATLTSSLGSHAKVDTKVFEQLSGLTSLVLNNKKK